MTSWRLTLQTAYKTFPEFKAEYDRLNLLLEEKKWELNELSLQFQNFQSWMDAPVELKNRHHDITDKEDDIARSRMLLPNF